MFFSFLVIHFLKVSKFSLQEQSTSLFHHSDLHRESFNTSPYGSSVEFPAYGTSSELFSVRGTNNFSLTESNGNSFPINNHIAMDNWNSGDVTPVPSNWLNNFTPTHQNFGGIRSNPRHNSGYSNQAGIIGSYHPNLDRFPQSSNSRQIYHPEYASSSSGTGSPSLELPDLYPPSMPMQPAGQSRDVLPRDVYNQLTPDQKLSRKRELSVKRSTKHSEKKKNERESLKIQEALEESTNLALTQEHRQKLKERDILEKAIIFMKHRNGNFPHAGFSK